MGKTQFSQQQQKRNITDVEDLQIDIPNSFVDFFD